jgi:hypothetical protein
MPQSQHPRNVFVYDANVTPLTPPILVAGFSQFGHTTSEEFYFCLEMCFQTPQARQFRLTNANGVILSRNEAAIVPIGTYYVVSPSTKPSLAVRVLMVRRSGCLYLCCVDPGKRPAKNYFRRKCRNSKGVSRLRGSSQSSNVS